MYHDVCDDVTMSGFPGGDAALYKLSIAKFREQMLKIALIPDRSPSVVTEVDITISETPLLITFDDGGKGAMTAADILDEQGWKGHFFVTTGRIDTDGFLTRKDIMELFRRGHIIGSHSDSHPLRMATLSREELDNEWKTSISKLQDIIGAKILTASVPGGYYSNNVRESAMQNGIRFLFNSEPTTRIGTTKSGVVLGRYSVTTRLSSEDIRHIAEGKSIPRLKQSVTWALKKPLKKLGGESFLKLRKAALNRRS